MLFMRFKTNTCLLSAAKPRIQYSWVPNGSTPDRPTIIVLLTSIILAMHVKDKVTFQTALVFYTG